MNSSKRWQQRFYNFERSLSLLQRLTHIKNPSEGEKMGIIQAFEMTFELSWKLISDYQKEIGYDITGPRNILKKAFQDNMIQNGPIWIEALETRNQTAHTYDQETANKIGTKIKSQYLPEIVALQQFFKSLESE